MEGLHEVVAIGQREEGIVQGYFWNPGNLPEKDVFKARLGGRSHRDRVAITTQAGGNPEDIELGNRVLTYRGERHPLLRGRHHKPSVLEEKVPSPAAQGPAWRINL